MDTPRLIAVLPCYSLDDIAKNLDELTCQEFHACWTTLWHPGLLARTNVLPEWKRADQGSLDIEKALVVCPASSSASIDTPLTERLETQGCQLIFGQADRASTLGLIDGLFEGVLSTIPSKLTPHDLEPRALAALENIDNSLTPLTPAAGDSSGQSQAVSITPDLDLTGSPKKPIGIDDFYALGFAYLMLQALTRKVHYSSNIDVVVMADQAKSAALAYLANDSVGCERWLQSCFDQLSQERDRYFTQSANLLELTLLAPSTLGKSLQQQLQSSHPQNILASASLLKELQSSHPEVWQTLLEGHAAQLIGIVGGLLQEREHWWTPLGTIQRDLIRGHDAYQALQVSPPKVFSRFEAGMSIEMPTHLRSAGYIGAILHAFSNGSYPVSSQAKIAWEASDTTSLDAICSSVLDAASYRSIFNSINELAKQFDHHQVPTLTCVHWPARTTAAFDDLICASRRTNAFGEWKVFEDYFESTGYVYSNQTFSASQFKFPWPESYAEYSSRCQRLQEHFRQNTTLEATRNIAVIVDRVILSLPNREREHAAAMEIQTRIDDLLIQADDCADSSDVDTATNVRLEIESSVNTLRSQIAGQLAKLLPRTTEKADASDGWLLINPYSGPRRYFLKGMSGSFVKTSDNRIYESMPKGSETDLVVDVPPMGVVQLRDTTHSGSASTASRYLGPNLASHNMLLANEFLECQVDPKNGYLRSIMIARKRGGRLSGMPAIAIIDPNSSKKPLYSTIANARSSILTNTALHSEIESTGELVLEGKCIAKFRLIYGLCRGSRSVDLRLKIEMVDRNANQARGLWDGVPIWRTAWPSQAASVAAWLQGTKTKVTSSQFFAPELIEIDDAEHKLYLAFAGPSIHRRVEMAFLDTLLPTDSNGVCEQNFQIAVDWPRPYQSYLESLDEPWLVADNAGPLRAGSSLWFAQTSVPNVRIDPIASNERLRLRLHETMGKEGRARLSFFRDATSAARVDHHGNVIEEQQIDKGQVIIDLKPNEISYLEVG